MSVRRCGDYVKETFQGDRYGVIDPKRWDEATRWLLASSSSSMDPPPHFGLDLDVWRPSWKLLAGYKLARRTLEDVKRDAEDFLDRRGRRASLVVITEGTQHCWRVRWCG